MRVPTSDSDANVGAIHELPLQKTLPEGWDIQPLENIVDILDNKRVPINAKERAKRIGGIPYYGATGQVGWIDDYLFDEELVLLGEDGAPFLDSTKQRAYIIRGMSWVNNHAHVLRARSGMPSSYIKYYLDIVDYHEFITGTTRYKLNQAAMRSIPVPIAPTNEQKLIVSEIEKQFSRLDEAMAALKRIKANLKRYKASVLKAAVEGKLTEEWRRGSSRTAPIESGKDLLKRILAERRKKWEKEHPGKKYKEPAAVGAIHELPLQSELPDGWVWATLSQLGELNRGKSKHRPRNAPHLYGGLYPFVQTGDIKSAKGILRQYTQTYSEAGLKQSKLWPAGTLCITIAANIADTAILGFDSCFPDSIVGFVTEPSHCDIRFLEYFIRTAKENIERFAPATAQKNINLEILSDIAVPLPPFFEQQFIVEEVERRLSVSEEIEAEIETNLKRAERLRQSILKKAFSGRLVPQAAFKRRDNS